MSRGGGKMRNSRLDRYALSLLLSLLMLASPTGASQDLAPRLQIGISLMPAVVAANKSLDIGDRNSVLPIYLLYLGNPVNAQRLVPRLAHLETIRDLPVETSTLSLDALLQSDPPPLAVAFLTEPFGERLDEVIEFSRARRLLLFSPFKGDVERGVAAGFRVTDKVLPMVNKAYLEATRIQLKAFFLRIAVIHE